MKQKQNRPQPANDAIAQAADTLYGAGMYMTSAAVEESIKDPVSPPSTQNEADTRAWCLEHET